MVNKNKLYSWLLALAALLAPLNLFFRWSVDSAYVNGLFSDYLIPKLWLAEIPVLIILFLWLFEIPKKIKNISFTNKLIILIFTIIFVKQFFNINPLIGIISFFRILEFIGLGFFLKNKFSKLNKKLIFSALFISFFGQIVLANAQFFLQRNLFDYKLLGESQLTKSVNIAQMTFKQGLYVSPYGSTSHPNILAGFLVVTSAILLRNLKLKNNKEIIFGWIMVGLTSWTLFLTQSYSAIATLSIFLIFKNYPKLNLKLNFGKILLLIVLISFGLIIVNGNTNLLSIQRRVFLNAQAFEIWVNNKLFGVGLGNFLYHLETRSSSEIIRFLQPVHNVFSLLITEAGLIVALLIGLIGKLNKKFLKTLLILVPIIALDHYLLTQWIGGWLFLIMVFL